MDMLEFSVYTNQTYSYSPMKITRRLTTNSLSAVGSDSDGVIACLKQLLKVVVLSGNNLADSLLFITPSYL